MKHSHTFNETLNVGPAQCAHSAHILQHILQHILPHILQHILQHITQSDHIVAT